MKTFFAIFFALVLAGHLAAQDDLTSPENLQNSDFSDGTTHWHGDCKPTGSDLTTDFTSRLSALAKGIVVDLHSTSWTKVTQDIHEYKRSGPGMVLTVVYQTSPDLKLSTRDSDYGTLGPQIGFSGAHIRSKIGEIVALVDVLPDSRASMVSSNTIMIYYDHVATSSFVPSTEPKPQTFTAQISLPPASSDNKPTFCLAFPPGSGSVTLLKVSLAPDSDRSSTP